MFLIPVGQADSSLSRWPWVGFGLLLANVAVFLLTLGPVDRGNDAINLAGALIQRHLQENPALTMPTDTGSATLDRFGKALQQQRSAEPDPLTALQRMQMRTSAGDWDGLMDPVEAETRLQELIADFIQAENDHPFFAFGLIPGDSKPLGFLTHMFMHVDWIHLLFNCLFLYIMGLLLESAYGHMLFVALYFSAGIVAAFAHIVSAPDSAIPMIGASGAISGVLGAFLVRLPRVRVNVLWSVFFIIWGTVIMPGWLLLAIWLGLQIYFASGADPEQGGVAFMAHIGGFVGGFLVALLIAKLKLEPEDVDQVTGQTTLSKTAFKFYDNALNFLHAGELDYAVRELGKAEQHEPGHFDIISLGYRIHMRRQDRPAADRYGLRMLRALMESGDATRASQHWYDWHSGGHKPVVLAGLRYRLAQLVENTDPALARTVLSALAADASAGAIQDKAAHLLEQWGGVSPEVVIDLDEVGAAGVTDDEADSGILLIGEGPEDEAEDPDFTAAQALIAGAPAVAAPLPPGQVIPTHAQQPPPTHRGQALVKVTPATIDALEQNAMVLGDGGYLSYLEILGIAGAWATAQQPPMLVLDLVLAWGDEAAGAPAHVLRIPGTGMNPKALLNLPNASPMGAFAVLVDTLIRRSGAVIAFPENVRDDGTGLPKFRDASTMEEAVYGPRGRWTQSIR